MSKIIALSFVATVFFLYSCGGGWSEDQKDQLKNTCIGSGLYDCDCYVETIVKAHENPDEFNKLSQADKDKLVESCANEEASDSSQDEDLESF